MQRGDKIKFWGKGGGKDAGPGRDERELKCRKPRSLSMILKGGKGR